MNEKTKPEDRILTNEEWRNVLTETFRNLHLPYNPTLTGPLGIQIDFCRGARIHIPPTAGGKFRVVLTDLDNDIRMYDGILDAGDYFVSKKRYFINYGIQITEYPSGKKILQHRFNAKNRPVLIKFPVETLGDTLAWFNAAVKFRDRHKCELYVRIAGYVRPLLEKKYPDIHFVTDEESGELSPYAVYTVAIFHNDADMDDTPTDYRIVPLHHYADCILGTEPDHAPPMIDSPDKREIAEPYVCIASQASGGVKLWHHPTGWDQVVMFLKEHGYRVIDIDRDYVSGKDIMWNRIPREAEDFTGNAPLSDRAAMIRHADFFIGLGSGLSWLAWCAGTPTVLIGGFSEPWEEFPTHYRVINRNVCHGCFNDVRHIFDHKDYTWCPKHKGTPRHWECSRGITPKSVIDAIKRILAFQIHESKRAESKKEN